MKISWWGDGQPDSNLARSPSKISRTPSGGRMRNSRTNQRGDTFKKTACRLTSRGATVRGAMPTCIANSSTGDSRNSCCWTRGVTKRATDLPDGQISSPMVTMAIRPSGQVGTSPPTARQVSNDREVGHVFPSKNLAVGLQSYVKLSSQALIGSDFEKRGTHARDRADDFWPHGASNALLRFAFEQQARRDKIVPAKRKMPCPMMI